MELRPIPNTELKVSTLCLGTMTFGTPVAADDAIRIVHHALESGINFIDTANIYEGYARVVGSSGGVAEEILGRALQGRHDGCVLATKAGMAVGDADDDKGLSVAHLRREVDKSLRRLRTDVIDLYYLHKPDDACPIEETVTACAEFIAAGKIRHWGFSNFDAAQTAELLAACDAAGLPRPVANQAPLNLLQPDAATELLPACERVKIATVAYQPLRSGLLSGKYSRGQVPAGSRLAEKPAWMPDVSQLRDRLNELEDEAHQLGRTLMQHALCWALEQPGVVSLAVGVKSSSQLDELMRAVER